LSVGATGGGDASGGVYLIHVGLDGSPLLNGPPNLTVEKQIEFILSLIIFKFEKKVDNFFPIKNKRKKTK
jgi:hypothetical protein